MKIYGLSWHFSSLHFVSFRFIFILLHESLQIKMVPFYRWIFAKSLKLKLSLLRLLTFDVCCRSLWLYTPVPPCLWGPFSISWPSQLNLTHHIHIFVLKMQFWYLTFSSILKCLEFKGFFMQILHEHFQIRITYEFLSTSLCMQIHVLGKWRRPTRIRRVRKSTMYVWLCLWHKDNDEFIMKE